MSDTSVTVTVDGKTLASSYLSLVYIVGVNEALYGLMDVGVLITDHKNNARR